MRSHSYKWICSSCGWLCIAFAAYVAIVWFFWCPVSKDFGVMKAQAAYGTMLIIPPFIFASACLMYLAHRPEHHFTRVLYWLVFIVTMLIWSLTFGDFYAMPSRGWEIILGGQQ